MSPFLIICSVRKICPIFFLSLFHPEESPALASARSATGSRRSPTRAQPLSWHFRTCKGTLPPSRGFASILDLGYSKDFLRSNSSYLFVVDLHFDNNCSSVRQPSSSPSSLLRACDKVCVFDSSQMCVTPGLKFNTRRKFALCSGFVSQGSRQNSLSLS